MTQLANPISIWLDGRGALLDAGYIYIGVAGTDPTVVGNQLPIFWDKAQTIAASQPLRTLGGVIVNGLNLGQVYFAATDYSTTIKDADSNLVAYAPNAFSNTFQPLDSDLTTISAQTNAAFGLALLEAPSASTLRSDIGLGTISTFDETTAAQFRSNTAGKALSTDKVWGAALPVSLTSSGGTTAIDLNSGFNFIMPLTENTTLGIPTNGKDGQSGKIEITQNASAAKTVAYHANWLFAGGIDPTVSTTLSARDVLTYEVLSDGKVVAALIKGVA